MDEYSGRIDKFESEEVCGDDDDEGLASCESLSIF